MGTRRPTSHVLVTGLRLSALVATGLAGTTAVQARHARRRYGGAPPAAPAIDTVVRPPSKVFADGCPLELVALGDSAMAGVGVDDLSETLPVQVARCTATAIGRPVHVVSHAVSGARTRDVLEAQVRQVVGRPDVIMLLVGTNDVTHFVRRRTLRNQTTALLTALNRSGAPVVMCSLPEFRAMRAIPALVRVALAREAAVVRRVQSRAAEAARDVALVDVRSMVGTDFVADASLLSPDRFHPSALGYGLIAEALSPMVIADAMTMGLSGGAASTPGPGRSSRVGGTPMPIPRHRGPRSPDYYYA